MRVFDVRLEPVGDSVRLIATVAFERAKRAPLDLFFEVDEAYASALRPRYDPFVVALAPAASWAGEERLLVEGEVCPVLRSNLLDVVRVLAHWYERCTEIGIEAAEGVATSRPASPTRRALLFSGGVDALAALRQNRLDVPLDHPSSIRDGLYVFGLGAKQFQGGHADAVRLEQHGQSLSRFRAFGKSTALDVLSVRTNVRALYAKGDEDGWGDAGFGAGTVAVAHALTARVTDVVFGSSGAGMDLIPHGSHPLLDERLSSGALRVLSGLPITTRFEKVGMLCDWPEALENVQSCLGAAVPLPEERINCGHCEKCRRTMLALEAWGALVRAPAFPTPTGGLDGEAIRRTHLKTGLETLYGEDLIQGLEARGREDLAAAVRELKRVSAMGRWGRRAWKLRRSIRKRLPFS